MSLDSVLASGRRRMSERMVDTFAVKIPTGGYTMVGGVETPAYTDLFVTPGYLPRAAGLNLSRATEVGERTSLSTSRVVRIPWDAQHVPANAVLTCTAIGASTPPRMLGKSYRVGGSSDSSATTACDLEITEVLT